MTVIGSYKDSGAFSDERIKLMCRETVDESLDAIQAMVKSHTPIGHTGRLIDSIERTRVKHVSAHVWYGEVFSDLFYAASIEYGWKDRIITPNAPGGYKSGAGRKSAPPFGWLKWTDAKGTTFARTVTTSYGGKHMFQKGRAEFEGSAEQAIARGNAAEFLGATGPSGGKFDARGRGSKFRSTSTGRFVAGAS